MAQQNIMAYYWRGEDYGAGSGNTREFLYNPPATAVASGEPITSTLSFTLPNTTNLAWFRSSSTGPVLIKNRNRTYYITLYCTMRTVGSTTASVALPIAPLDQLFLPPSVLSIQSIQSSSPWAVNPLPVATNQQNQTVDFVVVS